MSSLYNSIVYEPLYNGLILLMNTLPWADAGIIVILFTVIVKLILFPLSKKAVETQIKMKAVEPELTALKEQYKGDRQVLARKQMDLYKEKGIRPFMSILLIFIQLPIIFALYRIFLHPGLPTIDESILYAFVHVPQTIDMFFLWLDISKKSLILAVLVGISTFFQAKIMVQKNIPVAKKAGTPNSIQEDFARNTQMMMLYVFPFVATFISWSISGAIALYWITGNLFTIGQEIVLKRKLKK
ncbi:YidC/Oxa1 family membrane protein insertase [Candidatus Parcubacteria bacterium]|nr:YidC/Oxa1 family membrane protein insertase [Candidatus Parcubacteria bacterium]